MTAEGGIAPILRGAVKRPSQEIDTKVVDELRNFLFQSGGAILDLAAINIQRGRETGIPDYNTVRKALGLKRKFKFYVHRCSMLPYIIRVETMVLHWLPVLRAFACCVINTTKT